MADDDFDPLEPPPSIGDPLAEYLRAPPGLGMMGTVQFVLAGLVLLLGVDSVRRGSPLGIGLLVSTLAPAGVLCAAGAGLLRRRAWGWWLTAALFYCVFFNLPVNLILWTTHGEPFLLGANLLIMGLAIVVLVCLTRNEWLRFIRFNSPDGRPAHFTLISPALAGLCWSIIRLVIVMLRHSGS